uniref:Uncharacterized protein n=1 Tax=Panagrolaimus sp. ES5 TaxID=591445 RepID=A0AC34F1N2_9BILA
MLHHKDMKWRLRSGFAEECMKLCQKRKISPEQINQIFSSFALKFMDDKVHGVRIAGAQLLAEIFSVYVEKEWSYMPEDGRDLIFEEDYSILNSMPLTRTLLYNAHKAFYKNASWRRRQTWAIFLEFVTHTITKQQFCYIFRKDIYAVAHDSCRNTRMKFCQILESLLEYKENETPLYQLFPSTYSVVRKLLEKMAKFDSDFEIQTQAQIILGLLNPTTDCLDFKGFLEKRKVQVLCDQNKQERRITTIIFFIYIIC